METENINNINDINNTNHINNTNNASNINNDRQNIALEQQKQSLTFIEKILTFSVNKKASDVHLKVNSADRKSVV